MIEIEYLQQMYIEWWNIKPDVDYFVEQILKKLNTREMLFIFHTNNFIETFLKR